MTHLDQVREQLSAGDLAKVRSFFHHMPKIDLHRHLEGSLRLQTLTEIAVEHGIDLPAYGIEELRPYVQVTGDKYDFHEFLAKFRLLRRFYRSQEAVERVAYEAVADAAQDNIRYLELRFNPVALSRAQNFSLLQVTEWVSRAIAQAQKDHSITARLILQIGREESLRIAEEIVDIGISHQDVGVVGIDLAGDEINYPPHRFAALFYKARQEGLGITVHAGEAGGAENVQAAIHLLHAQRIGHGVRVVEDSNIVHFVRNNGVTLEVCPTSNLQTGVVLSLSHHPLLDLLALGVLVTINTDDPSISDTTLTDEYMVALLAIGLEVDHVRTSVKNSINASFLPQQERRLLGEQFREWDSE
ncbi:MAG: adenosine deaminase [Anaerolineae bacterium]|nr:adenosine deaminase [Anaerolineae bacterium]